MEILISLHRGTEKKKWLKWICYEWKNFAKWNIHVFNKSPNEKPESQNLIVKHVFEYFKEETKRKTKCSSNYVSACAYVTIASCNNLFGIV